MQVKAFIPEGHAYVLDESGDVKDFEVVDYHHTVKCVICEDMWCDMCHPDRRKEVCPERAQDTLPGLEFVPRA